MDKLAKIIGAERLEELKNSSVEKLKETIVTASMQKSEAKRELEANPNYQQLKADMKALKGGYNDLSKELNAVIRAAVELLEEKGGA